MHSSQLTIIRDCYVTATYFDDQTFVVTTGKVKFPDTLLQHKFMTLPVSNQDVMCWYKVGHFQGGQFVLICPIKLRYFMNDGRIAYSKLGKSSSFILFLKTVHIKIIVLLCIYIYIIYFV